MVVWRVRFLLIGWLVPSGLLGILVLLVSLLNVPPSSSYWSAMCSFLLSGWLGILVLLVSWLNVLLLLIGQQCVLFLLSGWLGILVLLVSWLNVPPSSYWSAVCSFLLIGRQCVLFVLIGRLRPPRSWLAGVHLPLASWVFFLVGWLS